ncbi:MAG TPA: hypothetical protein VFG20_12120, partial [Planctomycetaceae bacterium]|nr:hypothetical protein [Planctomycetaceae bacterium]
MPAAPRFSSLVYERWFAAMLPNYQGDVNCVLEFDGHLDTVRLERAFLAALAAEPMWSYRFIVHWWTPYWQPIPRVERSSLVSTEQLADDTARTAAWNRILDTRVDAAARVFVLRTPANDHLLLRVDHCLADATAARLLLDAVAENYRRDVPVPETDGPVIRRTAKLLRPLKSNRQRLKAFGELIQFLKRSQAGRGFALPTPTEHDPPVSPQFLRYPPGSLDRLTQRAMRNRATAVMVIMAVTYVALRDLVPFSETVEWPILLPVNLRRYLPPEQQPAPASLLTGQVGVWVKPGENLDLAAVIEQVRSQLSAQRGPDFGLTQSPLSLDVPILRTFAHWNPFSRTRRTLQKMRHEGEKTPMVLISDLGECRSPGDDWAGVRVTNGYCT